MPPSTFIRCSALALAVLFSACTVDDIARAKDELVRARALKRAKTPVARRDAARAKALATAVQAFVRTSDLGRPRVTVREDEVIVRFSQAALARRLLPDGSD